MKQVFPIFLSPGGAPDPTDFAIKLEEVAPDVETLVSAVLIEASWEPP